MTDFKTLKVWQKAHTLVVEIDRLAGQIRGYRHAALRSQLIRAAMSIPANLAEGCRQESVKEYARFVRIALNSSTELEYHLIAARDLRLVHASTCLSTISQVIEVRKMLYGLLHYLRTRIDAQASKK